MVSVKIKIIIVITKRFIDLLREFLTARKCYRMVDARKFNCDNIVGMSSQKFELGVACLQPKISLL